MSLLQLSLLLFPPQYLDALFIAMSVMVIHLTITVCAANTVEVTWTHVKVYTAVGSTTPTAWQNTCLGLFAPHITSAPLQLPCMSSEVWTGHSCVYPEGRTPSSNHLNKHLCLPLPHWHHASSVLNIFLQWLTSTAVEPGTVYEDPVLRVCNT